MSTLHLPLKGIYFDQFKRGEKIEEYREANSYWAKRLESRSYFNIELTKGYPPKADTSRRISRPWLGCRKFLRAERRPRHHRNQSAKPYS